MITYHGKGIHGAIAIGKAELFRHKTLLQSNTENGSSSDSGNPLQSSINPQDELMHYEKAVKEAIGQLEKLRLQVLSDSGASAAEIFQAQQILLQDETYHQSVKTQITENQMTAADAIRCTCDEFSEMLTAFGDPVISERVADIRDISERLLQILSMDAGKDIHNFPPASNPIEMQNDDASIDNSKNEQSPEDTAGRILCADDLTPSEAVSINPQGLLAYVTAYGSPNSHMAILAKSRGIPAIVCVGEQFLEQIQDHMELIVDSFTGEVILEPDTQTLQVKRQKLRELTEAHHALSSLKGLSNKTSGGKTIALYANINGAEELQSALENDAGGIGLFRSEYLFLSENTLPSEESQFQIYKSVLEHMQGKEVTIRTLDIGADKTLPCLDTAPEINPALGMRGIRLSLSLPDLFRTQLRALFRASAYGKLRILFPMISSADEISQALAHCNAVRDSLRAEGISYAEDVKIGIMIETPAAALLSDRLAQLADFFSIGTNDLSQYTLAMDRQNPALAPFEDPSHRAVLKLIELSTENAHRRGIPVSICGELASDPAFTETFLRMGVDCLSVSPDSILPLRKQIRSLY